MPCLCSLTLACPRLPPSAYFTSNKCLYLLPCKYSRLALFFPLTQFRSRAQEEAATLRLCVRFAETASIRGAAGAGTGSCAETVRQRSAALMPHASDFAASHSLHTDFARSRPLAT
eukprot:2602895-Rhodomonas_salina.2